MAERFPSSSSLRWVGLSLLVLVALAAFNHSLSPLVKGFGLAHARLLEGPEPQVLVVDNIGFQQAAAVQTMFPIEIWGRHAYRVDQIALPALALAVALGFLSHFLAQQIGRLTALLGRFRSNGAWPPFGMWLGLASGLCIGLKVGGHWGLPLEFAILPFAQAVLWLAAVSLSGLASAARLRRALIGLHAARWFALGFVLGSDVAIGHCWFPAPSHETVAGGLLQLVTPRTLAEMVVAFLLLHWATRPSKQVGLQALRGDSQSLLAIGDQLSVATVQELWILLPLAAAGATSGMLELVPSYLLLSVVCSWLTKLCLESSPVPRRGLFGRIVGCLCRTATIGGMAGFAAVVHKGYFLSASSWPIALPFIAIGLGLVRGQPWFWQRKATDFAASTQPTNVPRPVGPRLRARKVVAGLASAVALFVAISSSLHQDWRYTNVPQGDALQDVNRELRSQLGHGVRLLQGSHGSLLLSDSLTPDEATIATNIVRARFPNTQLQTLTVEPWRWEGAGGILLAVTLGFTGLAALAIGLGLCSPAYRIYRLTFAALAGANGAFALGSHWGWFWLDSAPFAGAFILSTLVAWTGFELFRQIALAKRQARHLVSEIGEAALPAAEPSIRVAAPTAVELEQRLIKMINVDVFTVELGRGLLALVDPKAEAPLPHSVASVRKHIALDLGVIIPGVRFRDNLQLMSDTYSIKVRGVEAGRGKLKMGSFLAIGPEDRVARLSGSRMCDPTHGMPGVWINKFQRGDAEHFGCLIFDPASILLAQLTEIVRRSISEIITLEFTSKRLEQLALEMPATVEEVRKCHSLLALRDVYRGLAAESVSLRDQETILNALAGRAGQTEDLVATCRLALRRSICQDYLFSGALNVIAVQAALERELLQSLRSDGWSEGGAARCAELLILPGLEAADAAGLQPIFLVHPRLRAPLSRLLLDSGLRSAVLATDEIAPGLQVNVHKTIFQRAEA